MIRRALLARAAAAGGAAAALAVLQAMAPARAAGPRPALPPQQGRRVLILGAGVAGLVAALELHRAGAEVLVLEAAQRIGGRSLTLRGGDTLREDGHPPQSVAFAPGEYLDAGPARIPFHHRGILAYARELGVPMQVLVNENRAVALGGATLGRVRADLRGVVAELALKALGAGMLDAPVSAEELERLRDMLRFFGALGPDGRYRGSSRAGWRRAPGMAAGEIHAPLPLSLLADPALWRHAEFAEGVDYAATMLAPEGGMDAIVRALAGALPAGAIRLGAPVVALDPAAGLVRLADGRVERGERILCALPPTPAARIAGWSPARAAALAAVPQEDAAKLGIQAPRFWEGQGIYGGIAWLPRSTITQLWYPSQGFHRPRGVLVGAYVWEDALARRFAALPPEARMALALREGAALHPELPAMAEGGVSVAWSRMPWAGAAWAEWSDAARAVLLPGLLAAEGRVWLAGDWLSAMPGWQEGAVASAFDVLSRMG